jgi:hypothetical protein
MISISSRQSRDGRYRLSRAVTPNTKHPQTAPSWKRIGRSGYFLTFSNQRQLLDLPQCLVHTEHEILIFLCFKRSPVKELR